MRKEKSPLVVTSSLAEHRISRASRWLTDRLHGEEVVIVAASRHAADDLARRIAQRKGSVFGWHRLSLPQIARTIAEPLLAVRQLAPLSRLGNEAMTARAVLTLASEGKLGVYGPISKTPGFPKAISSVLSELRLARISPNMLHEKLPDLASILQLYENSIAEAGLTDWPGVLAIAAEAIGLKSVVPSSRLVGLPILMLDVSIATDAEFFLIRTLIEASSEFLATVPTGDEQTLEHLRGMPGLVLEPPDRSVEAERSEEGSSLRRLQQNLFG